MVGLTPMAKTSKGSIKRSSFAKVHDSAESLTQLIYAAYDFLEEALDKLKTDPKRSVIEFSTAVELFLKVPLLQEHWSLITSKIVSKREFLQGNFVSVTFQESVDRLDKILVRPIPTEIRAAFEEVRKHRNRYVHFYNDAGQTPIEKIAVEQLRAWAGLHRLITNDWAEIFEPYKSQTRRIERSLRSHKDFARAHAKLVLPDIEPKLNLAKSHGATIEKCRNCGTNSVTRFNHAGEHVELHCLICSARSAFVMVNCPQCANAIRFEGELPLFCSCKAELSESEVMEALNTEVVTPDNYFESVTPASCGECQGYETVCAYHEHYLCTQCLTLTDAVYSCEWCNASYNTPQDESGWDGCEQCDGKAGHIRDD